MNAVSTRQHLAQCRLALRSGALALLLLLIATPTQAQTPINDANVLAERCFAVANEPGPLDIFIEVNLETGEAAALGTLNSTDEVEAIAFVPAMGVAPGATLYGANAGQFGRIEIGRATPGSGAAFQPIGAGFGVGEGTAGPIELDDVDGLAYDVFSNTMFGVHRREDGAPDVLFRINIATGAVIRDSFSIAGASRDYAEIDIIDGLHDIDDIAIDPGTGAMRGVLNADGESGRLLTIDPANGAVLSAYPIVDTTGQIVDDIEGLAFDGSGTLFGSTGENGPDEGDSNQLFSLSVDSASGVATAVQVSAFPPGIEDVEALGCLTTLPVTAAIDIEKATNGQDADMPTGPLIVVGDPVEWTYVVVNTGEVALDNVLVSDNRLPAAAVTCPQTTLAVGESITCTATGIATAGQYANVGTVNAIGAGQSVSDSDPSHHFGILPAIDIEKATNGVDADTADEAPLIVVGEDVTWTYVLHNSGNTTLTDISLDDNVLGPITCAEGTIPTLAPGDTFTCSTSGVAGSGPYMNVGTTSGAPVDASGTVIVDQNGAPIEKPTDSDPSHYVGLLPAIDIEKATNGQDADTPTGPQITVGNPVQWRYVVTNTGDITLSNVTVVDDQLDAITCPTDTLPVGASMTCSAAGTATAGQYANVATAVGYSARGNLRVDDSDPSHYIGILPGVDITKTVDVSWRYVISNTGETDFADISVDGGPEVTVTCPQETLAAGASMSCPATGPPERFANTAVVTAFPVGSPTPVVINVPATPIRGLQLVIQVDGAEVGLFTPVTATVGRELTWSLIVRNNGVYDVEKVGATLIEPLTGAPIPAACPSGVLAVGASTTCSATSTAAAGSVLLVGSVAAQTVGLDTPLIASTLAQVRGIQSATVGGRIFIDRLRNGAANGLQDADERGLSHPDLSVRLYRFDGTLLDSSGVDASGLYSFTALAPDDYYISVLRPVAEDGVQGFQWTTPNAGNDSLDSDAVPTWDPAPDMARSEFFRLGPGQQEAAWDIGFKQIRVDGVIWFDSNGNGVRDPDESGAPGVTVQILNDAQEVVATTSTNDAGLYLSPTLDPGSYSAVALPPRGFVTDRVNTPTGAEQTVNISLVRASATLYLPVAAR